MPMMMYGIFTAYPPGTEFQYEGLGRYLTSFVRNCTLDPDIHVVIACPSWSRQAIRETLKEAGVADESYSLLGPERPPLSISLYQWALRFTRHRRHFPIGRPVGRLMGVLSDHFTFLARLLSTTRNHFAFVALGAYLVLLGLMAFPFLFAAAASRLLASYSRRWWQATLPKLRSLLREQFSLRRSLVRIPTGLQLRSWAFQFAQRSEIETIILNINADNRAKAWYCPTAIWPAVADIQKPVLICVPDIVLAEFPIAFAQIGGAPMAETFTGIIRTLDSGAALVTYSERIKRDVLVERFGVLPERVHVIPHGANRLNHLIDVANFAEPAKASDSYCRLLVRQGLRKAFGAYARDFHGTDFRFLFYPSQLRPSKNVLTLLRAFQFLLKERYVGGKLVLTGNPETMPAILAHVAEQGLLNDVVFLPGLSDSELAAFYRRADLAVNPSLSEGGMPFTFTEAVSVGTPVVMSDIAVTREVLTDEALCAEMLFDGHDWRAMASLIEAALANRQGLYSRQRAFFDEHLSGRTWQDVVREHLVIMDGLTTRSASSEIDRHD